MCKPPDLHVRTSASVAVMNGPPVRFLESSRSGGLTVPCFDSRDRGSVHVNAGIRHGRSSESAVSPRPHKLPPNQLREDARH